MSSTTPLTFDQKFALFKEKVNAMFELPDEAWPGMKQALIDSQFDKVEIKTVTIQSTVSAPATTVVSSEGKFLNGYNVFIKESKTKGKDFKTCGEEWKALSHEAKEAFNTKAKLANQASGATSKSKGKSGKLSGWNVYMKENNKLVKAANPTLGSQDVLKKLGADWKALGKEAQEPWNAKAKGLVA